MSEYKPTSYPALFGAAAIALTALTIGLAVVLPARTDSSAATPAATVASDSAASEAVAGRIRIEVVAVRPAAARETWLPVEARAAAPTRTPGARPTHSSIRSVTAPERIGYHGAAAPARCPYLINGTVEAAS